MVTYIHARTLLSSVKPGTDKWFGLRYNLNLYRGCQHGCIYCDSRSKCYGLGDLSEIRIKANALTLLDKELKAKREKGTIGFGSMNDPYMPVESETRLTRQALQIVAAHHFPVHLLTKGTLVTRDIDLLKEISKVYAAVSFTITAADDKLSKKIEPGAHPSSDRFRAMEKVAKSGLYCGMLLMPVLPMITDSPENIEKLVQQAASAGASYIIACMGMTIREGQREFYYKQLDIKFPGLKADYINLYGLQYSCNAQNHSKLWETFHDSCLKWGIETRMKFYTPDVQMNLF